jgi:adenine-specific DNA-methyltransferase
MTRVFIGGSRRIESLPEKVRERLDRIMEKEFPVLIGDAKGADSAVQEYLRARGYGRVEVFCMEGKCRNNKGKWAMRAIAAPKKGKGFDYYSIKDEQMTRESTIGLMLWDGKSKGTLANVTRLLGQGKKVVVYIEPQDDFVTLTDEEGWKALLGGANMDSGKRVHGHATAQGRFVTT